MRFYFSRRSHNLSQRRLQRFFEIMPAATSWCIIVGMLVFSFLKPLIAAALIIAFNLYWLLRLFYMVFFLLVSYAKLSPREKKISWLKRIDEVDNLLQNPKGME